ncbi:MAG: cytochrome c-type biogenesis protein CcmH [Alphaproteobacteria bacterium]|nr:cytochrome c-type biogenesis protein CcmH [Alphaproteobacteria bacterium]
MGLIAMMTAISLGALAVEPSERLADPALESRAREVSKALRCVVCQNESIDDSNAELAKDMRILVRDRINAGDSNQAVLDYMVERYGDFVLLKPRVMPTTIALWVAPAVLLALGLLVLIRTMRRRAMAEPTALSSDEALKLKRLMDGAP